MVAARNPEQEAPEAGDRARVPYPSVSWRLVGVTALPMEVRKHEKSEKDRAEERVQEA